MRQGFAWTVHAAQPGRSLCDSLPDLHRGMRWCIDSAKPIHRRHTRWSWPKRRIFTTARSWAGLQNVGGPHCPQSVGRSAIALAHMRCRSGLVSSASSHTVPQRNTCVPKTTAFAAASDCEYCPNRIRDPLRPFLHSGRLATMIAVSNHCPLGTGRRNSHGRRSDRLQLYPIPDFRVPCISLDRSGTVHPTCTPS